MLSWYLRTLSLHTLSMTDFRRVERKWTRSTSSLALNLWDCYWKLSKITLSTLSLCLSCIIVSSGQRRVSCSTSSLLSLTSLCCFSTSNFSCTSSPDNNSHSIFSVKLSTLLSGWENRSNCSFSRDNWYQSWRNYQMWTLPLIWLLVSIKPVSSVLRRSHRPRN